MCFSSNYFIVDIDQLIFVKWMEYRLELFVKRRKRKPQPQGMTEEQKKYTIEYDVELYNTQIVHKKITFFRQSN